MRCTHWLPFVSEGGALGEPVAAAAVGRLEEVILGGPKVVDVTGGRIGIGVGGGFVVAIIGGERVRLHIRVGEAGHGIEADGGRGGEVLGADADADAALVGVVADGGARPAGGGDAVAAGVDGDRILVADGVRVGDEDQNAAQADVDREAIEDELRLLAGVYSAMESIWLKVEAAVEERDERRAEARRSGDWKDAIRFSRIIEDKVRVFIKNYDSLSMKAAATRLNLVTLGGTPLSPPARLRRHPNHLLRP
uniref:Uncharacterized protein n=1 Tax=Oryza glumipatula TaxID=40148 RepID=A0A0D9Y4B7_9ORYZ